MARFLSTEGLAKWAPGNNPKKAVPHAKAKERATARAERAELAASQPAEEAAAEAAEEATEAAAAEIMTTEEAPAQEAAAEAAAEPVEEASQDDAAEAGEDTVAAAEEIAAESPAEDTPADGRSRRRDRRRRRRRRPGPGQRGRRRGLGPCCGGRPRAPSPRDGSPDPGRPGRRRVRRQGRDPDHGVHGRAGCAGALPRPEAADGAPALTLTAGRPHKGALVARAREVATREDAEALRGLELYVPRDALPPPDEDEFYLADLIGLRAVTPDGAELGRIKSVQNFGAGDLLEIAPETGPTWWLPFTKEAVPEVRIAEGLVVVIRPEEAG